MLLPLADEPKSQHIAENAQAHTLNARIIGS
jgi:hypothetical protein